MEVKELFFFKKNSFLWHLFSGCNNFVSSLRSLSIVIYWKPDSGWWFFLSLPVFRSLRFFFFLFLFS